MKMIKRFVISIIILILIIPLSSCWNYREINKLAIVSGVAIDRNQTDRMYKLTAEIVSFSLAGKGVTLNSRIIQAEGDTIFDAVRNMIKTAPKRLYWGHSQIFIVSQSLARDSVIEVIDWVSRDQETRSEAVILISKETTAGEILLKPSTGGSPICFDIYQSLTNQRSLSKAFKVEIYKFINTLSSEGISCTLPVISLTAVKSSSVYEISGTAIFKKDKLIGFIDGADTKYLLFANDNIEGGLLITKEDVNISHPNVSLEIYESKTKVKPEVVDDELIMQINIKTKVAIAELGTSENFVDETKARKLKADIEKSLEGNIKNLISKVQTDYKADIFGFGRKVRVDMPDVWRSEASNWDKIFENLNVDVSVDIEIIGSAFTSQSIKIGD